MVGLSVLTAVVSAYFIALNRSGNTFATAYVARAEIAGSVYLMGELAVGALAGWLWYRREWQQVSVPRR